VPPVEDWTAGEEGGREEVVANTDDVDEHKSCTIHTYTRYVRGEYRQCTENILTMNRNILYVHKEIY
jgi:hypothetical protein